MTTTTEVTPELRLKRLNMLLEANDNCPPELFDMNAWRYTDDESECGTTHCLAGNYATAFPLEGISLALHSGRTFGLHDIIIDGERYTFAEQAMLPLARHFGITGAETNELFFDIERDYADSLQAVAQLIAKYAPENL